MATEKIIIEIDKDGSVQVEAVGFKGKACMKATEFLEKILGKVTRRTTKPDYYDEAHIKVHQ